MASYAHLEFELKCPLCNRVVTDMIGFQWGHCLRWEPIDTAIYHIGNKIRWKTCSDGSIKSWSYFGISEGNIGDPRYQNLITRAYSFELERDNPCRGCNTKFCGAVVEIVNGVIHNSWIYLDNNEFDMSVNYFIVSSPNRIEPKPEWNDHPMPLVVGC